MQFQCNEVVVILSRRTIMVKYSVVTTVRKYELQFYSQCNACIMAVID